MAVRFRDLPDPNEYADDFFFGYLVAATVRPQEVPEANRGKAQQESSDSFTFKRDSVLRMNLAKALEPYRHNAIFTSIPLGGGGKCLPERHNLRAAPPRDVVSAFQYPFALSLEDCRSQPDWTRKLLKGIGELNDVAGNHARSYFEMAPASIVVRLSKQLVAGYETYGFKTDGTFPEVVEGILHEPTADYPGNEFYLGGKIVKEMKDDVAERLVNRGVTLDRDPRRL